MPSRSRDLELSVVVPVYRDAEFAGPLCDELWRVLSDYYGANRMDDVEVVFVNDDGSKATAEALRQTCEAHVFAKAINLSRNFGQHVAITCGFHHARGRRVAMLNSDMEDPPAELPRLLDCMDETGADIVTGVRAMRESKWSVRTSSRAFNWALNKATGYDLPLNVATLRVMQGPMLEEYCALPERNRFIPGLEAWLGFDHRYVPIAHRRRTAGASSYSLRRRIGMAFNAIISFSDLPLRFVVAIGMSVAALGALALAVLVVGKLFISFQPGYSSTIAVIVLFGGMLLVSIGVASLYIGRILSEVQGRPMYIVRDTVKIDRDGLRALAEETHDHRPA